MKFIRFEILIIILTVACSTLTLPIPSGTPSPSPAILVDTFFYGYAYLDTNHNGEIDTADTPLAGAIFSATDANGLSTHGITGADGLAMAWWPAESEYPVTFRMQPPEGSGLVIIGKAEVTIHEGSNAKFLFNQPATEAVSQRRCGDGVCDGPETNQNCPADCNNQQAPVQPTVQPTTSKDASTTSTLTAGSEKNTYWMTNPSSGTRLFVRLFHPSNWNGDMLPTLVAVAGGTGTIDGQKASLLAAGGFTVIAVDPDGRGQSEGQENLCGFIHQDGLAALISLANTLPGVDGSQIGLITFSYGVTMGTGVLARYPDLPIRFLIDWEGPADRQDTTFNCKPNQKIQWPSCSDDNAWMEREALTFITQIKVPYQRVQSAQDHAQKDVSHALNMINAAVQAGVPWVRLNDYPPNQVYDLQNPPAMLPENQDKQLEEIIAHYAQELFQLENQ